MANWSLSVLLWQYWLDFWFVIGQCLVLGIMSIMWGIVPWEAVCNIMSMFFLFQVTESTVCIILGYCFRPLAFATPRPPPGYEKFGSDPTPNQNIVARRTHEVIAGAKDHEIILFGVFQGLMVVTTLTCWIVRGRGLQLFRLRSAASYSRLLLSIFYLFNLAFIIAATIVAYGFHMNTASTCSAAIQLCLVFYLSGKAILYLFIIERIRAIRQTMVDRCADIVWQRCTMATLLIVGQIAVICFFYPVTSMAGGFCTIGLPTFITIPMLVFDISCNLVVSYVFYILSREQFSCVIDAIVSPRIRRFFHLKFVYNDGSLGIHWRTMDQMPRAEGTDSIMAHTIRKTLVISVLILLSTIANSVVLFCYGGAEHAWLCFLTCSLDITWNVLCVTYLVGMPTRDETHNMEAFRVQEQGFKSNLEPHGTEV